MAKYTSTASKIKLTERQAQVLPCCL